MKFGKIMKAINKNTRVHIGDSEKTTMAHKYFKLDTREIKDDFIFIEEARLKDTNISHRTYELYYRESDDTFMFVKVLCNATLYRIYKSGEFTTEESLKWKTKLKNKIFITEEAQIEEIKLNDKYIILDGIESKVTKENTKEWIAEYMKPGPTMAGATINDEGKFVKHDEIAQVSIHYAKIKNVIFHNSSPLLSFANLINKIVNKFYRIEDMTSAIEAESEIQEIEELERLEELDYKYCDDIKVKAYYDENDERIIASYKHYKIIDNEIKIEDGRTFVINKQKFDQELIELCFDKLKKIRNCYENNKAMTKEELKEIILERNIFREFCF